MMENPLTAAQGHVAEFDVKSEREMNIGQQTDNATRFTAIVTFCFLSFILNYLIEGYFVCIGKSETPHTTRYIRIKIIIVFAFDVVVVFF